MNLRFLTLLLSSCLFTFGLFAQINQKDAQGRKDGKWEKKHSNGKIRYTGNFDHGTPVGTFIYYFDDGKMRARNTYRAKSGINMSEQFGEEEKLAAKGLYLGQEKDSTWTYYDFDGNLIMREDYQKGVLHGKVIKYYPNGKMAEVKNFKNGVQVGEWNQFYDTGKPKAKGNYVNGALQGEATYYFSNGKPRLKGNYSKGKMHGIWYYFTPDLKVEKKEQWEYGFLIQDRDENDTTVAKFPHR